MSTHDCSGHLEKLPKSTVAESPRIVDRMDPDSSEFVFDLQHAPRGATKVRAGARGVPAITALARVLIVLFVVAGIVAIVMGARTPREDPRRRENPCTERIQRIERTEYIERTCAPDGS
jgi:hypothetical protein